MGIQAGTWVEFLDIDLSDAKSVSARYGTVVDDGYIEVRLGSSTGELIGTIELTDTEGWNEWGTVSADITSQTGTYDVYFVYQAESSSTVCYSNWFQFSGLSLDETTDPMSRIEAEDYDRVSGMVISTTTDVDGEEELGSIDKSDWLLFKNIDLTDLTSIDIRLASPNSSCRIELRLDSYDGTLLSMISIPNTGSLSTWETASADLYYEVEGECNVYLVFKGTDSADMANVNWLQFSSVSTDISVNSVASEILLYPNPVIDNLIVNGASGAKVQLYNSLGKLISVSSVQSDEEAISLSGLASGFYLVRVIMIDGTIESFKVLKSSL